MNKKRWTLVTVISLLFIYSIGPRVDSPEFSHSMPLVNSDLILLEDSINTSENFVKEIKEDNQARIIWQDSIAKNKTPISIVYLHGFTASGEEGNPTHRLFAEKYGCNLYIARLDYHGIGGENQLQFMTPEGLYTDAKRAIAIGKSLGDEVIVMSTSTGGTLALYYAAHHDDIKALINYSPNIRIKQKASYLLDKPWGLQLARLIYGGKYKVDECDDYDERYWNCKTRLEAVINLEALVENTMLEETFTKITTPTFTAGYYKNDSENDPTVSVKAMKWMHDLLATKETFKKAIPFPEAGTHVIANGVKSKSWQAVYDSTCAFAEEVLMMKALADSNDLRSHLPPIISDN
jgi:esterase/lipase